MKHEPSEFWLITDDGALVNLSSETVASTAASNPRYNVFQAWLVTS